MKNRVLRTIAIAILGAALLAVAAPAQALACGGHYAPPEATRDQASSEVFVGRILQVTALETSTLATDQTVTLYELTVHVDETLKGTTSEEELSTVYVVALSGEAELAALAESGESAAKSDLSGYSDFPAAPEALSSHIFFASAFEDGVYSMVEHSNFYMPVASESEIATARTSVNSNPYIY